ncbi:hypothetical protein NUW58_g3441 [Xylaria curta]|uniref:Uncharacterized protein n=1 Tax=Xylaria curta TaxID=42375 RepID=A0ACC1PBH9_9PEZI|nr:hypothetical protein NUW58_g3441 [Xylaria curta]
MPPPADRAEILETVRRAKAFKLCLRRVWAVAASLPDGAKSLPTLIPTLDMFPVPNHNNRYMIKDLDVDILANIQTYGRHHSTAESILEKAPSLDGGALNPSRTPNSQLNPPFDEDRPISKGVKDWKALFYLEQASQLTFEKTKSLAVFTSPGSKHSDDGEVLICPDKSVISNSHIEFRAFFYGNRGMIPYLEHWLKQDPELDMGQRMLLVLDGDNEIKFDLGDIGGLEPFLTKALHFAIGMRDNIKFELLVTLLLDNHAQHGRNADEVNNTGESALHVAARNGHLKVVKLLLKAEADASIRDLSGQLALHYAASGGHNDIMPLLIRARNFKNQKTVPYSHSSMANRDEFDGKTNEGTHGESYERIDGQRSDDSNRKSDKRIEDGMNGDTDKKSDKQTTSLPEVDYQDNNGQTALHLAARNGHTPVVDTLLRHGTQVYAKDNSGQTALLLAAEKGRAEIVEILLAGHALEEAEVNKALLLAAAGNCRMVVRKLHKSGARSGTRDATEMTALHWTIEANDEASTMLLIENQDDLNVRGGEEKQSAFIRPVNKGLIRVVFALIRKGADVNLQDSKQRTALHWAAYSGSIEATILTIEAGANTSMKDRDGRSALIIAAIYGRAAVVNILLHRGSDPKASDNDGRSALDWAATIGPNEIVRALLPNIRVDKDKKRALELAANGRHFSVAVAIHNEIQGAALQTSALTTILFSASATDVLPLEVYDLIENVADLNQKDSLDIQDVEGRTLLLVAAERGYSNLVRALLEFRCNPNTEDKTKRTPLLLAAERGDPELIQALLDAGADPNRPDIRGRTALAQASRNGHEYVVFILFSNGKAKPNLDVRDVMGRTALLLAAESGHASIVDCLLDSNAKSTIMDYDGKKALQKAMEKGHASIVRSLLSMPDILTQDRKAVNEALLLASRKGWAELTTILLDEDADMSFQSKEGWTALHMAAMSGHQDVMKLLHHAARNGNWGIAQMLVNHGADPHIRDLQMKKAWQLAAEAGYHQIARLLLGKEINLDPNSRKMEELFLQMAERGLVSMVQSLLENGVNEDATDPFGRTAIGLAAEHGKDEVVRLLLLRGADPSMPDLRLKMPLLSAGLCPRNRRRASHYHRRQLPAP